MKFTRGKTKFYDVTIDHRMEDTFWHPGISILHLLSLKRKGGLGYGTNAKYFARNKNAFVLAEDVEITFTCNFKFKSYPFDYHECFLTYFNEHEEKTAVILNTTTYVEHWGNRIHFSQNNNSLIITNTTTPFIVSVEIKPNITLWGAISASRIKINFQRNSYALLMGSFYAPTGIFAIMSMTSYVINPDIVSFN